MGLGRGMGRCAPYGVFKSEGQAITAGVGGICAAAIFLGAGWFAWEDGQKVPAGTVDDFR